ncbi:MAG: hypothetical protein II336_17925 [Loktanella sp.]|nr:hypothetical protein [Loktanella sp.]
MIHQNIRPALTTAQFLKLRDMGYPDGCSEWEPVQLDTEYSIFQRKQRRRAFWFTAFVVAGALLCVWGYGR